MVDINNVAGHRARYETLLRQKPRTEALSEYVGQAHHSIGHREKEAIARYRTLEDAYVIDIGCGIGRLTGFLVEEPIRKYLGTDVIPELLAEAAARVAHDPRFRFEAVSTIAIPEKDGVADIVCAFSVMTHLVDEEVYLYFQEAARVLRSGGVVAFSFFDFSLDSHQDIFLNFARNEQGDRHDVLKFFEKPTLEFFARAVGLELIEFQDAMTARPAQFAGRTLFDGFVTLPEFKLGQSIVYLRKP